MLSVFRRILGSRMFCISSLRTLSTEIQHIPEKPSLKADITMADKLYKTIELEIKSSEKAVMKSYLYFITTAARHLGINVGEVWSSRKPNYERYTLLKSIHIYRKHLVQYEIRTHFQWIQLHKLTGSTADTFLEYIQRMLPEGVAMKVTRISLEPLPSHLNPESVKEALEIPSEVVNNTEERTEQV